MPPIYLDHNSTTYLLPEVEEAMRPYFRERCGNARTGHRWGRAAKEGLERARGQVAEALGCEPAEIVFTGGASEANNLAVKGFAWASRERGRHLVVSVVEHGSIANAARWLAEEGWTLSVVGVDRYGMVPARDMIDALRPDTVLACLMLVQNEVGTIMPVREVAAAARERGVTFHVDASQAVGKVSVRVRDLGVDMCTVAAHKFYGPQGVGALYVRPGVRLVPLVHGVGHEGGLRSGTENVAGIVGLGAAIALVTRDLERNAARLEHLRARLLDALQRRIPDLVVNGHPTERSPNTLNVCLPLLDSNELLSGIPELAASTGAACHYGVTEPSATLTAMGVPREVALGAIRFSLGLGNTEEEMDRAAALVASRVESMRRTAAV